MWRSIGKRQTHRTEPRAGLPGRLNPYPDPGEEDRGPIDERVEALRKLNEIDAEIAGFRTDKGYVRIKDASRAQLIEFINRQAAKHREELLSFALTGARRE